MEEAKAAGQGQRGRLLRMRRGPWLEERRDIERRLRRHGHCHRVGHDGVVVGVVARHGDVGDQVGVAVGEFMAAEGAHDLLASFRVEGEQHPDCGAPPLCGRDHPSSVQQVERPDQRDGGQRREEQLPDRTAARDEQGAVGLGV